MIADQAGWGGSGTWTQPERRRHADALGRQHLFRRHERDRRPDQFRGSNNFGSGTITLNGGGLQWATGTTTDISAPLGGGRRRRRNVRHQWQQRHAVPSFGGSTGGIIKIGGGTLTLCAATHFVGTTINAGTLAVIVDNNLGNAGGGLAFGGGTLQLDASSTNSRAITLNTGGGTIDTNGNNATLAAIPARAD